MPQRPMPISFPWLQHTRLRALLLFAVALGFPGLAAAQGPTLLDLEVRSGAVDLACGGFFPRCEVYGVEGTLQIEIADGTATVIDAGLRLRGSFAVFPFPAGGDLPLIGLSGQAFNDQILLAGPADGLQMVELRLERVFSSGSSNAAADDWVLNGSYDEGCCDRFVHRFGNVVLTPRGTASVLLLGGQRFEVTVDWQSLRSGGAGVASRLDERSGLFWFFRPDNPELVVKLIDACAPPHRRFWFFAAGLTNVGVTIKVRDLASGPLRERTYVNPWGKVFEPVLDTDAFVCEPPPG